jgi:hypothetical protein
VIITKIGGGLGNQMFQAAAGLAVSLYHKTELKFDTSFLEMNNLSTETFTARTLEVNRLISSFHRATSSDMDFFFGKSVNARFKRYFYSPVIIIDKWDFCNLFDLSSKHSYLDGFWQSECFFKGFENEVKEYFRFPELQSGLRTISKEIGAVNSVSVHFRRGDYVSNKYIGSIHNVCNPEYYERAINLVTSKKGPGKFYLFSDDPEWVKNNFKSGLDYTVVNTGSDIFDLLLMSQCRHNIIANSSFSWWAAWLNNNVDKLVVAPEKWFATDIANYNGVVPERWIKV